MRRKESSRKDFERSLIADAARPDAWEEPLHVEPIASNRGVTKVREAATPARGREQTEFHIIGELAVWFANLELFLELAIWQLVSSGQEEQRQLMEAVTAEMSFDRKVHALSSLFKLRFPQESDDPELSTLIKELFQAQDERNAILHSGWSYSAGEQVLTRMKASAKAKHGLSRRVYEMPPERLASIRDHIGQVGQRFAKFAMHRIQDRVADSSRSSSR